MSKIEAANSSTIHTKVAKSVVAIKADLERARARYEELQKVNEAQYVARQTAITRRHLAELQHKSNPIMQGMPFDPSVYPGGLVIPSVDTPEAAEYHAIHETITRLENELLTARKALAGN